MSRDVTTNETPIILVKRNVLGEPAYVMTVKGESIVYGDLRDMLFRVARYMEPDPRVAAAPKAPGPVQGDLPGVVATEMPGGEDKKKATSNTGMTQWILDNLNSPMDTTAIFNMAYIGGFKKTTRSSVYSSLWHLRKRGAVTNKGNVWSRV